MDEFVIKSDQVQLNLKEVGIQLYKFTKGLHLLKAANLSEIQRHMLLAKINLQDEDNLYSNMKTALKDSIIKGQDTFYQKFNRNKKVMRRYRENCVRKSTCGYNHPDSKEKHNKKVDREKNKFVKTNDISIVNSTFNVRVNQNYDILDSEFPVSVSGKKWIEKFLNQFRHSIAIYEEKEHEIVDENIGKDIAGNPICYNALKVTVQDEEMFIKASTRTLSKTGERVPCADQLPIMFESRNGDIWIKRDSNGVTIEKKPDQFYKMFERPKEFNIAHTTIDF